MQKIGLLAELFPKVKDWMVQAVLPGYINLVGIEKGASASNSCNEQFSDAEKLILDMIKAVTANPEKV